MMNFSISAKDAKELAKKARGYYGALHSTYLNIRIASEQGLRKIVGNGELPEELLTELRGNGYKITFDQKGYIIEW